MGNQIKKKRKEKKGCMIRKWGQIIKAKRAQKPECLPYTEKEKKNSAILNPSPIMLTILKSRSFAIMQYKWEKKKGLETQIHMQQLNLHHFLFTVSSKGRNGLFLLCSGLFWVWSHYKYPQLSESFPCTTWLLQRFILVPVFANQKTSEEDVCFYEKCLWKVKTVFRVLQGVVTEAAYSLKRECGSFPGTTLIISAPSHHGFELCGHLCFILIYFVHSLVRCDLR